MRFEDGLVDFFGDGAAEGWFEEVAECVGRIWGLGTSGAGRGRSENEEAHGLLEAEEVFGVGRGEGGEVLVSEFEGAFGVFFCGVGEVGADHFDELKAAEAEV